jgi:hypothetical protein
VFNGPTAPVGANLKRLVDTSAGRAGVVPQAGTAYDPYAYIPLRPVTIVGDVGDPVPAAAPQAARVPRAPVAPSEQPARAPGAGAATKTQTAALSEGFAPSGIVSGEGGMPGGSSPPVTLP